MNTSKIRCKVTRPALQSIPNLTVCHLNFIYSLFKSKWFVAVEPTIV